LGRREREKEKRGRTKLTREYSASPCEGRGREGKISLCFPNRRSKKGGREKRGGRERDGKMKAVPLGRATLGRGKEKEKKRPELVPTPYFSEGWYSPLSPTK